MKTPIQLSDHFTAGRLLRFTAPSIVMMIFASIYSVVDGFFVSNFAGKTPFAAINLIMPFLMVLSTVGLMLGAGGAAIVSRTFGEGDDRQANRYFSLFVYVAFGLGVILAVLGIAFLRPIAVFLGATDEMLDDAVLYGRIILAVLPFNTLQYMFQSFFSVAEKPRLGLAITVAAGCTNMVLDAVLVILLPQEWKLAGAAIATAMSQIVGGVVPLLYFGRKNPSILRLGKTGWYGKAMGQACVNGSSEFMSNISMNIVAMLYNAQLLAYAGEDGVAAYGVMMYVSMIFAAAFMGYSMGAAPVVGFHFGAQNHRELHGLLRKSLAILTVFGVTMTLAAEGLAAPLSRLFVGYDAKLLALTTFGFRIFSLSFLFMGFAIFASGFFTALSDGLTSALISFLRTLVFQVGAVLLLPLLWGIDGIWYSIVAAEIMAVALSAVFLLTKQKKYHY